ncbi:MAG: hypothetical protein ABW212_20115, partial [Pseudonocardia sediminis]
VAVAVMTGRARVRPGPDARAAPATLLTRAAVLLVLGLALGWTDTGVAAVILPYYAVMFVLAVPLVLLPTRALVVLGSVIAVVVPVLSQLVRPDLPTPLLENPSFAQLMQDPLGLLSELALTGYYPALPWTAYVCAGIVVGRLDLSSVRTAWRLLAGGALAALVVTGLSWLVLGPLGGLDRIAEATSPDELSTAPTVAGYVIASPEGTTPTDTWWWLTAVSPHSASPPDLIATTGSALAVIGAALLLGHAARRGAGRILNVVLVPLAAAGSMTLTLYTASILFMNSPLDTFEPVPGYLLQVVAALAFGLVWARLVGRGPVEALVSRLAHAARDRARTGARTAGGPLGRTGGPGRHRSGRRR